MEAGGVASPPAINFTSYVRASKIYRYLNPLVLSINPRYLRDWPIVLPTLISPLSILRLKPHSGFEHTHALYVIGAPSRP